MSGNERTEIKFSVPNSTVKSAYHIHPTDTFLINNELMNLDNQEKWVWLTITFEYFEGFSPEYKQSKIIWMSIGNDRCGEKIANPFGSPNVTSTLHPKVMTFSEHSIPWTARKEGLLLGTNAHMHDGGLGIDVFQNDNKICSSFPQYNMTTGMPGMAGMHIDRYKGCEFDSPIPLKVGDRMYLRANYDFTKHDG
jgi:hypothetical protein